MILFLSIDSIKIEHLLD